MNRGRVNRRIKDVFRGACADILPVSSGPGDEAAAFHLPEFFFYVIRGLSGGEINLFAGAGERPGMLDKIIVFLNPCFRKISSLRLYHYIYRVRVAGGPSSSLVWG